MVRRNRGVALEALYRRLVECAEGNLADGLPDTTILSVGQGVTCKVGTRLRYAGNTPEIGLPLRTAST